MNNLTLIKNKIIKMGNFLKVLKSQITKEKQKELNKNSIINCSFNKN
jgi:hypothetical protein